MILATVAAFLMGSTVAQSASAKSADAAYWHTSYEPINDPAARQFMNKALIAAGQLFGKPKIEVKSVYLCLSKPLNPSSSLKRDFAICSIEDRGKGGFTLYMNRKPGEYSFNGQLAQLTTHLLNADLYDAYMSGLSTVFTERFLTASKMDFSGWKQWADSYKEPFMAGTYKMMREINSKVSDKDFRTILNYAVPNSKGKDMHIDIDAWLATLPPERRAEVIKVINRHAPYVKANLPTEGRYTFMLPSASHQASDK